MAYSFTEKKRIRKNFGKQATGILDTCPTCSPFSSTPTAHSCKRISRKSRRNDR